MIYTHVLNKGGHGVRSPVDGFDSAHTDSIKRKPTERRWCIRPRVRVSWRDIVVHTGTGYTEKYDVSTSVYTGCLIIVSPVTGKEIT